MTGYAIAILAIGVALGALYTTMPDKTPISIHCLDPDFRRSPSEYNYTLNPEEYEV